MTTTTVTCPACLTALRLPQATPEGRVRCPKCKGVFTPIVEAEVEESESIAVVLDETKDTDNSFFERLADADDPFAPIPSKPFAEAEPVSEPNPEPTKSVARPPEKPRARKPAGSGFAVVLVVLVGLVILSGIAGASYVVYRIVSKNEPKETAGGVNKDAPAAEQIPADTLAKVKAATVHVRTHFPDGQTTVSGGFFIPGPGFILTNARSIGQGKKPIPATKIVVTCGSRMLAGRILGADAELDLALLQVAGLDLPEPLPLTADTFTVREPMPVVVFSMPVNGDAKSATATNANVAGSRQITGLSRAWLLLGGGLPQGAWGGPVTDAAGRVIGVAGVIPGSESAAAVPTESALAFVQKAARSAESTGGIAFAVPNSGKTQPGEGADDTFRGMPNPWRQGRQPIFPPGFDPPLQGLPPGWGQPIFPPPNFPRQRPK